MVVEKNLTTKDRRLEKEDFSLSLWFYVRRKKGFHLAKPLARLALHLQLQDHRNQPDLKSFHLTWKVHSSCITCAVFGEISTRKAQVAATQRAIPGGCDSKGDTNVLVSLVAFCVFPLFVWFLWLIG